MACSPSACCGRGNGQSRRGRLLAEIGAPGSTVVYASGTLSVLSSAARLTSERRTGSHGSRPDLLGRGAGRVLGHHATGAALIINNDQIWPRADRHRRATSNTLFGADSEFPARAKGTP